MAEGLGGTWGRSPRFDFVSTSFARFRQRDRRSHYRRARARVPSTRPSLTHPLQPHPDTHAPRTPGRPPAPRHFSPEEPNRLPPLETSVARPQSNLDRFVRHFYRDWEGTAFRIEYAGALYHVMARGDCNEATVKAEEVGKSCPETWLGTLCYPWTSLSQLAKAKRLAYTRSNA